MPSEYHLLRFVLSKIIILILHFFILHRCHDLNEHDVCGNPDSQGKTRRCCLRAGKISNNNQHMYIFSIIFIIFPKEYVIFVSKIALYQRDN
jgi:hypothetical protein